jgi:tight adherence protein B
MAGAAAVTWLYVALALAAVPLGRQQTYRLTSAMSALASRPRWIAAISERAWWASAVCTVCAVLAITAFLGVALGLAAACVAGCAARLLSNALSRRRASRAAGVTLASLRELIAELEAGRHVDDARASLQDSAADLVDHAIRVSAGCGAPLAAVLGAVVDDLAAESRRDAALRVALAGTRSSAAMMAVLPGVGIGLGEAMGAKPIDMLLNAPAGHGMVLVAVLLDAAGLLWTEVIAKRAAA